MKFFITKLNLFFYTNEKSFNYLSRIMYVGHRMLSTFAPPKHFIILYKPKIESEL